MTVYQDDYAKALDGLRVLAQRDLLAWWKQTSKVTMKQQKRLLRDPFAAIVQVYGEQAAYAAADYLFMERSLDDTLRGLEYPEVADPVGFEQASKSYDWAMSIVDGAEEEIRALALKKLQAITNRLVVSPARKTVELGVLKAGTRYARVPEPGACAFCLMLGSRGAVYTSDSVFGELGRYHDNCRCLGIEVKTDADLPRLNRDLMDVSETLDREFDGSVTVNEWRQYITARRQQLGQNVEWPRLQYCRIPRYKGDGFSSVFPGEKLPPLDKMPGHVLHGWRDLSDGDRKRLEAGETVQGWPHDESLADGHRWDSTRKGASTFPKEWTDQKIADAVRDTLETPDYASKGEVKRVVLKEIDGVVIRVQYNVRKDGVVTFGTAYPESRPRKEWGKNVRRL